MVALIYSIIKYLLIETSGKQYVLWTLQRTEKDWNATCRQTCNAWMKPNFMSRHVSGHKVSRVQLRDIPGSWLHAMSEQASWCCFTRKGFFSPKTNHVFEINTTTVNFSKFSASFEKIQFVFLLPRLIIACVNQLGLLVEFGFTFPVGGSVSVLF